MNITRRKFFIGGAASGVLGAFGGNRFFAADMRIACAHDPLVCQHIAGGIEVVPLAADLLPAICRADMTDTHFQGKCENGCIFPAYML